MYMHVPHCLQDADWKASGGVTAVFFAPPGALLPAATGSHVLLSCHSHEAQEMGRVLAWELPGDNKLGPPGRFGHLGHKGLGQCPNQAESASDLGPRALAAPLRSFPSATSPYPGGVVHASLAQVWRDARP